MTVYINPGTGSVPNASLVQAQANMKVFRDDIDHFAYTESGLWERLEIIRPNLTEAEQADEAKGRFYFQLRDKQTGRSVDVEMPGIPIEKVRYMRCPQIQNIWDFPRLYIDGSSWVWYFAINTTCSSLFSPEEEEVEDEQYGNFRLYEEEKDEEENSHRNYEDSDEYKAMEEEGWI
jgi:hypothetical protein